jgi:hypothetical protein
MALVKVGIGVSARHSLGLTLKFGHLPLIRYFQRLTRSWCRRDNGGWDILGCHDHWADQLRGIDTKSSQRLCQRRCRISRLERRHGRLCGQANGSLWFVEMAWLAWACVDGLIDLTAMIGQNASGLPWTLTTSSAGARS